MEQLTISRKLRHYAVLAEVEGADRKANDLRHAANTLEHAEDTLDGLLKSFDDLWMRYLNLKTDKERLEATLVNSNIVL